MWLEVRVVKVSQNQGCGFHEGSLTAGGADGRAGRTNLPGERVSEHGKFVCCRAEPSVTAERLFKS